MYDLTSLHATECLLTQYKLTPVLLIPAFLRYSLLSVKSIVLLIIPPEFSGNSVWQQQMSL